MKTITNVHTYHQSNYYQWDGKGRSIDGIQSRPLPVHGIPMRAKDTLLATRLRSSGLIVECEEYIRSKRAAWREDRPRVTPKTMPNLVGKLLGVEIEYYPTQGIAPQENSLTHFGHDGSLNDGGREIRRLTWADTHGRLTGLLNLRVAGTVDRSCGLHVHVDIRHLGQDGLLGVSETYSKLLTLSRHLKKLVPPSRLRNTYCRWVDNRQSSNRYAAINFCAVSEHGTLEFRCQSGSVNLVKIESWALLCQFLVNWCAQANNVSPRTWAGFIAILPEPLRSWCILRKGKLYGEAPDLNERTLSAVNN